MEFITKNKNTLMLYINTEIRVDLNPHFRAWFWYSRQKLDPLFGSKFGVRMIETITLKIIVRKLIPPSLVL
jgi:hypothetical protein